MPYERCREEITEIVSKYVKDGKDKESMIAQLSELVDEEVFQALCNGGCMS